VRLSSVGKEKHPIPMNFWSGYVMKRYFGEYKYLNTLLTCPGKDEMKRFLTIQAIYVDYNTTMRCIHEINCCRGKATSIAYFCVCLCLRARVCVWGVRLGVCLRTYSVTYPA
jgi:hypothetical protein